MSNSKRSKKPLAQIPKLSEIRAEMARRSLAQFVRFAWHVVEPETALIWNWHIEAVCLHLEALTRQQLWKPGQPEPDGARLQRLVINIPPGTMKSLLVSVFWPAWEWIEHAGLKSIFSSYAMDLAIRDSVRCRDLLLSDWYRNSFKPDWEFKSDSNLKTGFANTKGGFRECLSVGSKATGYRGDKVVVDDPQNATEAHSDAIRGAANTWWDRTMSTRLNDPRTGVRMIIQQRLHEEDLTGHVLAKGSYEHLCLPSEFDSSGKTSTSIGWKDPRTVDGELLFSELFTRAVLDQLKIDLGEADFAGQHNQKPSPAGGLIFKRRWWKYWQPAGASLPPVRFQDEDGTWISIEPEDLPASFDETALSIDCSFKDSKGSDNVAMGVWSRKGSKAFLRDQVCEKMSFTNTVTKVRELSKAWPEATAKWVEDKANGSATIDSLKDEIPGLIPIEPEGGKVVRAHAVTPVIEAGNVYLPHPSLFKWVDGFLLESGHFPYGKNDDQVDQMTQALKRMLVGAVRHGTASYSPSVNVAASEYGAIERANAYEPR